MKRVFLDTNIIIDFFADRKPFSADAEKIFDLAYKGKIILVISAISYNNIYYLLRKSLKESEVINLLGQLLKFTQVAELSKKTLQMAITSGVSDFEDAIQYYSALHFGKVDCIVTRDIKGFKKSNLPVFNPHEILKLVESNNFKK